MASESEETQKTVGVAGAGAAAGAAIAAAAGIAFAAPIAIGAGIAALAYGIIIAAK